MCRSAPADRLDAINKVGLLFDYRLHLGSDDRLRPFMGALRFQPQYIGDIDQHLVETERIISRRVMTQRRGEVQVTLVQEGATKQLRARYERSRYVVAAADGRGCRPAQHRAPSLPTSVATGVSLGLRLRRWRTASRRTWRASASQSTRARFFQRSSVWSCCRSLTCFMYGTALMAHEREDEHLMLWLVGRIS